MHWIQTIRENLQLTQHELAGYLQLSVHTIQSMEQGRRELPFKSMQATIALYNVMKEGKARPVNAPLPETDHQCTLKRLHRRCHHKLVLCREKLQKMQTDYENACRCLNAYELLANALNQANSPEDLVRLKWTEWRIAKTLHCIKENNATAQCVLNAEIAALESRKQALESMFITDSIDQKNESGGGCQQDTIDEEQKTRETETGLNDNTKTLQARYFPLRAPLKRVEPEPMEHEAEAGYNSNQRKQVNRTGPDPGFRKKGMAAPKTRCTKSLSREGHYPNDDTNIKYNEGEVSLSSTASRQVPGLAKPIQWHSRVDNKEPVNSG